MKRHSHLPRLSQSAYTGHTVVFWTHCIQDRKTGWLDTAFQLRFRELLLHSLHRYDLACSAYVLMPDHFHLLVHGLAPESNQLKFNRFFRKRLNTLLSPLKLQEQGYDHVLRQSERTPNELFQTQQYVLENPLRKGLVECWKKYNFLGALVPGFPDFDPRDSDFWERFWKMHNKAVSR